MKGVERQTQGKPNGKSNGDSNHCYVKVARKSKAHGAGATVKKNQDKKNPAMVQPEVEQPKPESIFKDVSIEESVAFLKKLDAGNKKIFKKEDLSKNFGQWKAILERKLNLCIYGVGSKTQIVEQFVDNYMKDCIQLKIRGYSSAVKIENILMKMVQVLEPFAHVAFKPEITKLLSQKRPKNELIIDLLEKLLEEFSKLDLKLLLVFIDIDGKNFRELETHKVLAQLFKSYSQVNCLSMVATFSNYRETWMNYNFVFQEVSTFEPNELEMLADEIFWFNKKQTGGTDRLKVIYDALTEVQREVLKLLAEQIIKSASGQISYEQFYDCCEDEMIITSESQLHECLKEVISHNVTSVQSGCDGETRRIGPKNVENAKRS